MARLERWIVASRRVSVFDAETLEALTRLGANFGGVENRVHQYIHVTPNNKEAIEELLRGHGFEVVSSGDFASRDPSSDAGPEKA